MPIPFIIPFLFGVGVGATGAMAYMSTEPKKPTTKKKDNVIHVDIKGKNPPRHP